MDGQRFDDLARRLSRGVTRRHALKLLGGGLVAALTGAQPSSPRVAAQACGAPQSPCGNRCVDLAPDRRNCGGCGIRCPSQQTCQGGICACPGGQSACGNRCIDTQTDQRNCGTCGNRCAQGATCQGGACICPAGEDVCGNRCQNVVSDRRNCGGCGIRCPAGGDCEGGFCTCPVGQGNCNGRCVDLLTNRSNCGTCGNQCPVLSNCEAGACVCRGGLSPCGELCLDLQADPANCGACGNACPDGVDCVNGACSCPDGQILCGGGCFDPLFDHNHCGGCGNACAGDESCTACADGVCLPICIGNCPEGCRHPCPPCPSEPGIFRCELDSDCLSGNCNGFNCEFADTCFNGVQDGAETGVDCGGRACPACAGAECQFDQDCASRVCRNGICQAPTCSDGIRNGTESDVDCGGPSSGCEPCADGLICEDDFDCESGFCNPLGVCGQNTCTDAEQNGTETDIDCGGPDCPPCANGSDCFIDADCESDFCDLTDNTCRTDASCFDTVQNGLETDVDCGGPECPPCEDGLRCAGDDDCINGVCNELGTCGECTRPCRNSTFGDLVDCCLDGEFCSASGSCVRCSISPSSCQ